MVCRHVLVRRHLRSYTQFSFNHFHCSSRDSVNRRDGCNRKTRQSSRLHLPAPPSPHFTLSPQRLHFWAPVNTLFTTSSRPILLDTSREDLFLDSVQPLFLSCGHDLWWFKVRLKPGSFVLTFVRGRGFGGARNIETSLAELKEAGRFFDSNGETHVDIIFLESGKDG